MKQKAKVKLNTAAGDQKADQRKKNQVIEGDFTQQRSQKEKAVLADIEKKYGKGLVGIASQIGYRATPRLPTGVFALDVALGGGWARHRMNLIWGPQSSCKTYLMLKMIAAVQLLDSVSGLLLTEVSNGRQYKCAYVDVEGALDLGWAQKLGVNLDELYYIRPDNAEQAAEILEALMASGAFDIVVLDSLAAMTPEKELEGEMGDSNVGVHARINNQMFRKVQSVMNRIYNEDSRMTPTLFLINQEREKIGVMFGSNKIKPGGKGQDFYTTIEVHTQAMKMEYYDPEEKTMPKQCHFGFRVEKNKVAPPKVEGRFILAVVDDPEGAFAAGDVMEDVTIHNYAERLGLFTKIADSHWTMCGKTYKRKGDLVAEWYQDKDNAKRLRRQMLHTLFPQVFKDVIIPKKAEEGRSAESVADQTETESAPAAIESPDSIPA